MKHTPVYLCILDGFALGEDNANNAIYRAIKQGTAPFIANLFANKPYAQLECSGLAVGLPEGTMGNSEVNHLNMGAGRIVYQSIERINVAIKDKSFFKNEALVSAVKNCRQNNSTLHLIGLLQGHGGTVHASIAHLFALLKLIKQAGLKNVAIHLLTDGRDSNPKAAGEVYLKMLEDRLENLGLGAGVKITTVIGREIAMDRDTAWDKTLLAMRTLVNGQGEFMAGSAREAIEESYKRGQTDEFIRPTIVGDYQGMSAKDSAIYFNFRQDRTIQLTTAFCEQDLKFFNYKKGTNLIDDKTYQSIQALQNKLKGLVFIAMTEYYPGLNALTAFPEKPISHTVGEIVSQAGLKQLRLAGPEKFAHVTGWFSGRHTEPFPNEDRHLARDLKLKKRTEGGKRYDLAPEMTAYLETEYALKAIESDKYSLIVHNFQNGDMVGHTGNLQAATAAIGHLAKCLAKLVPAWTAKDGIFIITSDHGNADEMELNHKVSTQHSLNPVPLWALGKKQVALKAKGIVPDVGVTVLALLGLKKPKDMTAKSLLRPNTPF